MLFRNTKGLTVDIQHNREGHRCVFVKWKKNRLRGQCPMSFYFYGGLLAAKVWEQEELSDFHGLGMELFVKTWEGILCSNGTVTCLDYGSVG